MIYFFAGDNRYELKKTTDNLTQVFIGTHGDLALERLDAEEVDVSTILDAVQSMPFLASNKMVLVANASTKELLEGLLDADVPENIDAIVHITKLDKRASYYKKLAQHDGFKVFEGSKSVNLPSWVVNEVKDLGGDISPANARYVVERVGANQAILHNELEKLVIYNSKITRESIELLCDLMPQTSVFQLLDAAFTGRQSRAMEIYHEQRTQKVEPHAILGMIAWQLHILALIKAAGDKPADTIAKDAKLNPFVIKKSIGIAKRLSFQQIKKLLANAQELDILLKSKPVDADDALQAFLLKLTIS